jgi:hypothetical protein
LAQGEQRRPSFFNIRRDIPGIRHANGYLLLRHRRVWKPELLRIALRRSLVSHR